MDQRHTASVFAENGRKKNTAIMVSSIVASKPSPTSSNATTLEYYKTMAWIATSQVHSETFSVVQGNWVEVRVSCPDLGYCGQPEYKVNGSYVKIPQLAKWTVNKNTEQVFGMPASASGTITVYVPVIYSGIEYKGAILVSDGPG
jgi:hypothetical protein